MGLRTTSFFFNNIDFSYFKIKLLENNKINVNQLVFFNTFKKENNDSYDEKYCDPITNTLIDSPIMIPDNIIVDKNMIYRYLLTNKINPFNRLELNEKILEKYNNIEDVKYKVNEFNIELLKYKKDKSIVDCNQ